MFNNYKSAWVKHGRTPPPPKKKQPQNNAPPQKKKKEKPTKNKKLHKNEWKTYFFESLKVHALM